MRPPLLLFVTVTVLISCASAVSTGNAAELRSLRSIKTTTNDDAAEEERGGFYHKFDFNFLDDIFHGLPEQFQRMRNQPERLRTMFENWKTGCDRPLSYGCHRVCAVANRSLAYNRWLGRSR
ncbi:hypothetical protein L915_01822, partial [Phytophthora nicotianae]